MADLLSGFSIQYWLESCPQGYMGWQRRGRPHRHGKASADRWPSLARVVLQGRGVDEDSRQPGLRMRVDREARRISSQHRQLDTFYAMVLQSLSSGRAARARAEFLRFHDALEAHFTVEERIHFPALHGLRPALDEQLAELVEDHRGFREDLDVMAGILEAGDLAACARHLDRFVVALAAHEGREEQMAERLSRPDAS